MGSKKNTPDILIAIGEWILTLAYLAVAIGFGFRALGNTIRADPNLSGDSEIREFMKELNEQIERTSETIRNWERRLR